MGSRLVPVTASTTFDYLETRIRGDGWDAEGVGVLDVHSPREASHVSLQFEQDDETSRLAQHAHLIDVTPAQARTLAEELELAATAAEQGEPFPRRGRR